MLRLAAFVLVAPAAHAQPLPDSLGALVETRLLRDRTRVRGDLYARVGVQAGPWRVRAAQRFVADGFGRGAGGGYDWRDDLALALDASRAIRPTLDLSVVSATVRIPQARVTRHETLAGLVVRPAEGWQAALRAGGALDARPGALLVGVPRPPLRQDQGPALDADLQVQQALPDGVLRASAHAGGALLGPRRAADLAAAAGYVADQPRLRVRADSRLRRTRRDTYNAFPFESALRPDVEAVEATTSDTLDVAGEADVALGGPLRLALAGAFGRTQRRVRAAAPVDGTLAFDTDFTRQTLDADAALVYDRPGLAVRLGTRSGAAREARRLRNAADLPPVEAARKADLLLQTNFARSTRALVGAARWTHRRLAVVLDAERSILRFDTPEANPDDRDEARLYGRALVRYAFPAGLAVQAEALGTDLHTVYLRRARSAESQRTRTLQLRPRLDAALGPRTRLSVGTEVRATYTRDDFVLPGRDRADQSAREWRLESALAHTFSAGPLAGLVAEAEARASDLRLGRLLPDRFAEVPYDTLRTASAALHVGGAVRRWQYRVGWQAFVRTDAERALAVSFRRADGTASAVARPGTSVFVQTGPAARLRLPLRGGSEVRVDGWYALQRASARLRGLLPEADRAAVDAAARGTWRLQPSVEVTARWVLW